MCKIFKTIAMIALAIFVSVIKFNNEQLHFSFFAQHFYQIIYCMVTPIAVEIVAW